MDIIVCIKRVPETAEAEIKIEPSGVDIVKERLTFDINEADNYALEEAILLKEKTGGSITLVTLGPKESEDTLRMGLAKGADTAIRIDDAPFIGSDGLTVARALASAIRPLKYDVIFTGCASSDDGYSQVGPALAEYLGVLHSVMVTKVEVKDGGKLRVEREVEGGGFEALEIKYPALLGMQTGYNEPRYASVMSIRKASRKEIKVVTINDLGLKKSDVGKDGSFSWIDKLFLPESGKMAQILQGTPDESSSKLAMLIKERGLV